MKLTHLPCWCANPCEESLPNRISCTDNAMWVNNSANRCRQEVRRFGVLGREVQEKDMGHLLLSGCRPEQTSADYKFREGWYGAMTYHFAKAVLRAWRDGTAITYREAHEATLTGLEQGGFGQKPQLEGPDRLKDVPVFGYES